MDKVIIVGVGVAVAVGTALYYLLTQEKPMENRSRPSNRNSSSRPRPRSPPVAYSEVRPKPCQKRKPARARICTSEDILEISCHSEPDRESGEKLEASGSSTLIPSVSLENQDNTQSSQDVHLENQDAAQSSQALTSYNDPIFTECRVCEENANATFNPCKHKVFCYEHAEYYFRLAEKHNRDPLCPNDDCRYILKDYF